MAGDPTGTFATVLERTFGGVDRFRRQMTEAAVTVQGSGWALVSWEPVAGRIVVQQVHDHQGNHGQGTIPLLAIDAWEHGYYLQYESERPRASTRWNVVHWADVGVRFDRARQADLVAT